MIVKINGKVLAENTPVTQKEMVWRDLLLGMICGFLIITTLIPLLIL